MEERGYTVVRLLGQGGQGRVYEVNDREGKRCVVKQLPWLGEDRKETALREVHLLSALRHPCIVRYLDSFLARSSPSLPGEDIICLVMICCEHDLRHECLRAQKIGQHFEESLVITWLTQLCWGLQHLHARKFLHRDLKPQNVLLTYDRRVLLADFGVVGKLENSEDLRGTVIGTPAFMSPEMLEGKRYGCKTDIWALGCVLYELMALEPPFASCKSYAAVVVAVLQTASLEAPVGYGAELSALVEALLSKAPDARPMTAEILAGFLREPFRKLLQSSADEFREAVASAQGELSIALTPKPNETHEFTSEAVEYASDFESESYSGSETEETPSGISRVKTAQGDVHVGEWRQLHFEAEALLQPVSAPSALSQSLKLRRVLVDTFGSHAQLERAVAFLRERCPLIEAIETDEMVLQIEVFDHFGDVGVQALPLLERCLALEAVAATEAEVDDMPPCNSEC